MSLRCDRPSCEWPAKLAGTGQAGKAGLSVALASLCELAFLRADLAQVRFVVTGKKQIAPT